MGSLSAEQRVRVPLLRASWLLTTFVHWRVAGRLIQPLLPDGLTASFLPVLAGGWSAVHFSEGVRGVRMGAPRILGRC